MVCQLGRKMIALGALSLAMAVGCSRSGLLPGDLELTETGGESGLGQGGFAGARLPSEDAGLSGSAGATAAGSGSSCVPVPETCNGIDDDCNGVIDDLPSLACPGGGARYCVGGVLSDCPRRCDVCVPGSVRVCEHSFCKFWGEQECAADGQSFGTCREADPPPECAGIASAKHNSPELEQCCIDNGYCCADEFDLDHDGNKAEVLGQCDTVVCQ